MSLIGKTLMIGAGTLLSLSASNTLQADEFIWAPPSDEFIGISNDAPLEQTVIVPVDNTTSVLAQDVQSVVPDGMGGELEVHDGTEVTAVMEFDSSISTSEGELNFYSIGGTSGEVVTVTITSVNGEAVASPTPVTLGVGASGDPVITNVAFATGSGLEENITSIGLTLSSAPNADNSIDGIILAATTEVPIPEPGTYALLGAGLAVALGRRKRLSAMS